MRASEKKNINDFTSELANQQSIIAKATAGIRKLRGSIADVKKFCGEGYSQLKYDRHLQENMEITNKHGVDGLTQALSELSNFFGETSQAAVESGYSGDTQGAQAIIGLMENLKNEMQAASNQAREEITRLSDEIDNLQSDTQRTVENKRDEERTITVESLTNAIADAQSAGQALTNEAASYSSTTDLLMKHKYEGKCADKQMSKEEELENKKLEIESLKEALDILAKHGKGTFDL